VNDAIPGITEGFPQWAEDSFTGLWEIGFPAVLEIRLQRLCENRFPAFTEIGARVMENRFPRAEIRYPTYGDSGSNSAEIPSPTGVERIGVRSGGRIGVQRFGDRSQVWRIGSNGAESRFQRCDRRGFCFRASKRASRGADDGLRDGQARMLLLCSQCRPAFTRAWITLPPPPGGEERAIITG